MVIGRQLRCNQDRPPASAAISRALAGKLLLFKLQRQHQRLIMQPHYFSLRRGTFISAGMQIINNFVKRGENTADHRQ